MEKKNYLITGGCGFLGSNIAAQLISQGRSVVVFDNLYRLGSQSNLEWLRSLGKIEFVYGDIRFAYNVDQVIKRFMPEVIFHLAGQVAMTTSLQSPLMDFEVNAIGSMNLLEAVRTYCPQSTVIYSSTNKVYGDLEQLKYRETPSRYQSVTYPRGLPEELPLEFHSPYGCSKGAADQYMLDYARTFGMKTVVFRHSSMFGERQFSTADQGWVGWFCLKALEQSQGQTETFTISGNGKQVRDILHADDMVRLYLLAAKKIEDCQGQAFNIGGGMENSLSILELLDFLSEELKTDLKYIHLPVRASDQKVFVADLAKTTRLLGWTPEVGWQEGFRRMLDWVRKQGV